MYITRVFKNLLRHTYRKLYSFHTDIEYRKMNFTKKFKQTFRNINEIKRK